MTLPASAVRTASLPSSFALVGTICAIVAACDDGPGVSTDQRAPDGSAARAGASGAAGAGQPGGSGSQAGGAAPVGGNTQGGGTSAGGGAGTGGSSTGGGAPAGGSSAGGGAQAGGANTGGSGAAGFAGDPCAGKPNPAGCFQTGCDPGFTCTQRADVCVPSGCVCGPNGSWECTADCAGGSCVADPGKHFARIGFSSGQQHIEDWCVAYEKGADGAPVFEPMGLLLTHFTDPALFDGLPKLTRYIELAGTPVAWGFTATGTCGQETSYGVAARDVPYQTVLAIPESGEAMRMWTLADSGPSAGTSLNQGARVINALGESQPVTVTLVGFQDISLGSLPFANEPGYTAVPGSSLDFVELVTTGGKKRVIDFTLLETLPVEQTTIVLRGFEGAESALVCNDAKPNQGVFGEPWTDVFSSACLVVNAK